MRLFVALEIAAEVRGNLKVLMEELRAADVESKKKVRWVPAENLHVTLKFIGNVDDGKLDAIRAALAEVRFVDVVVARFRGLGYFPNDRQPRVLWVDIEASANLGLLAGDIDARLEKLGIPRETREFAPHLTLARFDPPGISGRLRAAGAANGARDFGAIRTGEFHLFESKTRPTGAEYTRLSSFAFAQSGD